MRDPRESASELRAVAALVVTGGTAPQLVGACTLVTNGTQTVAFSSAELLRDAPEPLAIALTHDATRLVPVTAWTMARSPAIGIIDLGATFPFTEQVDVHPINIAGVSATVDTRGAPSALVGVQRTDTGWTPRRCVVHVDAVEGDGMSDELARLASPDSALDIDFEPEGSVLFSWMPADPVLGRPPETVLVALACTYRGDVHKPRDLPPIAELYGLEDLGRALPWRAAAKASSNELGQVAGEIKDPVPDDPVPDPFASVDIDVDID